MEVHWAKEEWMPSRLKNGDETGVDRQTRSDLVSKVVLILLTGIIVLLAAMHYFTWGPHMGNSTGSSG
jgi:hypothetical protein